MKLAIGLFALLTAMLASTLSVAQDNVWTGNGANDLWTNPSNWSIGIAPVNATTHPQAGWDDPTSPFFPLTPETSDDYPLGNNSAHFDVEGTRAIIDSSVNAAAFAVRVGHQGASNTLEITGGHLNVGGILQPGVTEQTGYFLDVGRGYNHTANPNPVARVEMSGGTLNANAVLIPEQFIDPGKVDPYETAPLNGEFIMTGGVLNAHFINLGQLVGNGRMELSGNAQVNLVQRNNTGFGVSGYLSFNRNWYDSAGQPIDSIGEVNLDVRDNAVISIFGTTGDEKIAPDEADVARYEGYAAGGWLTANNGTAVPEIILETIDDVVRITIRAPQLESLPGDYNNDGIVNAADYTVWRNNLGDPTEDDINNAGDGVGGITSDDYTWWKQRYGNTAPGAGGFAGSPVPEPSAWAILLIGAGFFAGASRRRSTNVDLAK